MRDISRFALQLSLVVAVSAIAPPAAAADGRIPIYQQTTITQPGSYYLTRDFSVSSGYAINILADHVSLDLAGHTITSTSTGDVIRAIGFTDIHIRNGSLQGGGFAAVHLEKGGGDFRVEGIRASDCASVGIWIVGAAGNPVRAVVERNVVIRSVSDGIQLVDVGGSRIESNRVEGHAIWTAEGGIHLISSVGNSVRGNVVTSPSAGVGIWLDSNSPYNNVAQNTVSSLGKGIAVESAGNVIDWNLVSGCVDEGLYITGTPGNVYAFNRTVNNGLCQLCAASGNINGGNNF